jgi:L,D-transpeptidase ErfK/SrfK
MEWRNLRRAGMLILPMILSTSVLASPVANSFTLPKQFPAFLGSWKQVEVKSGDTVSALAFNNGVSIPALLKSNPRLKTAKYLHPKEKVLIPSCYYAPTAVTPGQIVVNVATQTLFYRPTTGQNKIWAFPVTVGSEKHPTPIGEFYITKKKENPVWYPPVSVRAASAKRSIELPFGIEGVKVIRWAPMPCI